MHRDAVDNIALAREFGVRGRVIVPPEELGSKGDLNDWLCSTAKGGPEVFRKLLDAAMKESLTPWAFLIERLPAVPRKRLWEIEDKVRYLLADLAPIFRDSHLLLLADKTGLPFATLVAACHGVADSPLEDKTAATAPATPLA